jgi:hypothetical protein
MTGEERGVWFSILWRHRYATSQNLSIDSGYLGAVSAYVEMMKVLLAHHGS